MARHEEPIRELRLVVSFEGEMRKLCKLAFTRTDASVYVVPYAPNGRYSVGTHRLGEDARSVTFTVVDAEDLEAVPKVSFHESGQVHAYAGGGMVGPLRIPALANWRGAHIATVLADHARSLPEFQGEPRRTGLDRDLVLQLEGEVVSAALALYVNGSEARFDAPCPMWLTLRRPTLPGPLYVGLVPRAQAALADPNLPGSGVMAIGGWTPGLGIDSAIDFLYVRGT